MNHLNLNHKALAAAVALAFSAASGSAFAYSFSDGGYTAANTTVVNISGSSATNGQTKAWAQNVLCSANQVTYTRTDSNHFAIICTPKANVVALSAGKTQIAVVKNSNGGSGNGISKLAGGSGTLQYINVFQANPATGALGTAVGSNIGVSDEEPDLLLAAGAVTGGKPAGLVSTALNVVTFGTPVTLGLRNALQTAQIASGKLDPSCTAGNETEACMPSLSQSQIASIFGGQLVGWSELGLAPADDTVYVARRPVSSGTQAAARVFFLNEPCAANMAQFVPGDSGESSTKADACNFAVAPAGRVFEASGGGNVATCLTNHERNGRFAIGINSLELPSTTDTSVAYAIGGGAATGGPALLNKNYQRHIKIDGFAPTTFNTATGRYRFWFEATMNTTPASLTADAAALQTAMVAGFNDPAVLAPLNNTFNTTALLHAAGDVNLDAGILAPVLAGTPANPATEADTHAAPLMYYTHAVSGTPNSCQPAMSYHATGMNP